MEEKMSKIIFIVPYFGELPSYLEMWLKSVAYNKTIDFLLITDHEPAVRMPSNVIHLQWSWSKLIAHFQERFDFPISLETPYKLCDFKPAFGYVFENYIKDYDFWGNCDIDLVFGDIRKFVTEDILEKVDVFGYLGHFLLYRNTARANGLFAMDGSLYDYKTVFSTKEYYAFDEITGLKCIVEQNQIPHYYNDAIVADARTAFRQMKSARIKNYNYQVFYWEKGKLFRSYIENGITYNEEFLYLHFHKKNPIPSDDSMRTDSFYIFFNRFEEKQCGVPCENEIRGKSDWGGIPREKKERLLEIGKKLIQFMNINNTQRKIWLSQKRFNRERRYNW